EPFISKSFFLIIFCSFSYLPFLRKISNCA
ncbi:MAG: hypothetical protein ACI9IL_000855, partial [Rickettsiales bacterium]